MHSQRVTKRGYLTKNNYRVHNDKENTALAGINKPSGPNILISKQHI